nr:ATP-binding cassette domain-containing protein [Oceanospirillum sediminis]
MDAQSIKVEFPIRAGFFGKIVDQFRAVDDISLTLQRGQTVGIVDESGSGKSTLGKALLKMLDSEGHVRFDGIQIDGL